MPEERIRSVCAFVPESVHARCGGDTSLKLALKQVTYLFRVDEALAELPKEGVVHSQGVIHQEGHHLAETHGV